jgi:predicted ATPase
MQAVLDWSYSLLSEDEQQLFRALGIFTGGFTAEGAAAVATDAPRTRNDAIDRLADLVAKSLVVADVSGARPRFRLLETTRAYALERLAEGGEREAVAHRHTEYYRNLLGRAEGEVAARPAGEWLADYAPEIDNLRAALDWAFSPDGDPALGAALAAASINFWVAASLFDECSGWGARALAVEGIDGTREEMVLQFGVGLALTYSKGMTVEARKALTKALHLSETLGDRAYQCRTLYGLFLFTVRNVEIRAALQLAQKYEMVARNVGGAPAIASAEALLGIARYCLGEHLVAADHLSRALISLPTGTHRGVIAFGLDLRVCALCYRALTFWLLGFAERAVQAAEEATNEARDINHPVSLCFVLAVCNSLLLVRIGHLDAAESSINELIEYAGEHSLIPYKAAGICAKGTLLAARGDAIRAEEMLRAGLEIIEEAGFYLYAPLFLGRWAEALAACGRLDEALAAVERAQQRTEEAELLWFLPEVLRIKGEILLRAGAAVTAVEESFLQSLDLARRQKALAWELRTATSLARFWRGRDRVQEAREVLTAVYGRFTEGLTTADPKAAKALLDALA